MAGIGNIAVVSENSTDDVTMDNNEGRSGRSGRVRVGTPAQFEKLCSDSCLRVGSPFPSRTTGRLKIFSGGENRSEINIVGENSGIEGSAIGPQIAEPVVGPSRGTGELTLFAGEEDRSENNIVGSNSGIVGLNTIPGSALQVADPIGPSVVAIGNANTFADLCDRARLTGGPGDTAPVVEERGGGHVRPGRNMAPVFFLLIFSLMVSMASSQSFLVKTAFLDGTEIPIEFPEKPFNFRDNLTTGAKYRNLTVDAGTRAMTVASHEQSEREVDADEVYIKMCLKGLLGHLKSGLGTPLRKDGEGKSNIDELFDRDTKQGSDSRRNWGMFYPNITQKYAINFSGSARIGGSGRGFLKMVVVGGLVLATSAVLLLQ